MCLPIFTSCLNHAHFILSSILRYNADCLIVFTLAAISPNISVSELRHDSGRLWLEHGRNPRRDSDRQSLPSRPDPAACASYKQLYFPRESVTLLPPQCNTLPFSTGAPGHKEKSSNCHRETWPSCDLACRCLIFSPFPCLLVPGLQEKNDSCLTIK